MKESFRDPKLLEYDDADKMLFFCYELVSKVSVREQNENIAFTQSVLPQKEFPYLSRALKIVGHDMNNFSLIFKELNIGTAEEPELIYCCCAQLSDISFEAQLEADREFMRFRKPNHNKASGAERDASMFIHKKGNMEKIFTDLVNYQYSVINATRGAQTK